jgi:hypothetical protein
MKKHIGQPLLYLSIIVMVAAGCGGFTAEQGAISLQETLAAMPTWTPYPTNTPYETLTPYPTYTPYTQQSQTTIFSNSWVYSPGVRTGIPEVDTIIDSVLNKDIERLRGLIGYLSLECGTLDELGGPPRCEEGEPEGTLVQAFPVGGAEGHYAREETIDSTLEFITQVKGLAAVYQFTAEPNQGGWPAGDYRLVFLPEEEGPITFLTLGVGEGKIVILEYRYNASLDEISLRYQMEWLLPPSVNSP